MYRSVLLDCTQYYSLGVVAFLHQLKLTIPWLCRSSNADSDLWSILVAVIWSYGIYDYEIRDFYYKSSQVKDPDETEFTKRVEGLLTIF